MIFVYITVFLIPTLTINDTVHLYSVLCCSHCTICTQVDFTAWGKDMLSVFSWTWKEKHLLPIANSCKLVASKSIAQASSLGELVVCWASVVRSLLREGSKGSRAKARLSFPPQMCRDSLQEILQSHRKYRQNPAQEGTFDKISTRF